jgi:hypothetical protein
VFGRLRLETCSRRCTIPECRQVLFAREVAMTELKLESLLLWVVAVLLMMAPWALL